MRTYQKTHPWVSFAFNLGDASPDLWLWLGEVSSKCEHLSRAPLHPDLAQRLHYVSLAKGVAATTAIEGNTLSEEEVLRAVEGKLQLPPSKEYLGQEVQNILDACNRIGTQVAAGQVPAITPALICEYNAKVMHNLKVEEAVIPGQFRSCSVVVGNVYRGAPAEDCPYLVERLCEWLASSDFEARPGMEVVYATIKAIVAHLYLAWIHPFGDGNGRTARLVELHILLSAGIPSPAAHLLSNHYNETRSEYYRQLANSSRSGGEIKPFLLYAVEGFRDGLRAQLKSVWDQQWDIFWDNYVRVLFHDKHTDAQVRQRDLALALGSSKQKVTLSGIAVLTPQLAARYAGKTTKTAQRDLDHLMKLSLVVREEGKLYSANRKLILRFLPLRARPNNLAEDY